MNDLEVPHLILNSIYPKFLPSWLRAILFNIHMCIKKKKNIFFSLDRITCPDIYRAGDGVHKVFIKEMRKSLFNPLHIVYLYLEKKCFQKAKHIIANSNLIKKQIIQTYQINPEKISVIYNGINTEMQDYNSSYKKLSDEFKINNERIFLYVGSGFRRKGVKEFLELLSNINYKYQAFIVGNDKNIGKYMKFSMELGIDRKVTFTGPREDVNDFYAIADFLILPTHYEPFSNVILEAMLQKTVVFTTKQNGASEILSNDFIMKYPSDRSILNLIEELIHNDKKINNIKLINSSHAKEFSIEKNLNQTLQIINEYCN